MSDPSPRRVRRGLLAAVLAAGVLGLFAMGAAAGTGGGDAGSSGGGTAAPATLAESPAFVQDDDRGRDGARGDCPSEDGGGGSSGTEAQQL